MPEPPPAFCKHINQFLQDKTVRNTSKVQAATTTGKSGTLSL